MIISELTEDNAGKYAELIPAELLEDVTRPFISGMVGKAEADSQVTAAVIWELKNSEVEGVPTEVEILWFFASDQKDGEELLKLVDQHAADNKARRLLFEIPELKDCEKQALKAAGYSVNSAEGRDVYVTVGELAALKIAKKKVPDYVIPLSDISVRKFRVGILNCVLHGRYGLLQDLPALPMSRFDLDISCCVMTEEKISGFLLVHESCTGEFRVELLYAQQPDANISLFYMIRYAIRKAVSMYPEDRLVVLRRHNKSTYELIKKLFPDKKGEAVFRGEKRVG